MKMRRFAALCTVAMSIAISPVSGAWARDLVLANEGGFPPYNSTRADGSLEGFDIDIGTAICGIIDARCSWVTNEWSGIIPALQAKKFDVIIGGMGITAERKKSVLFSEPYARTYSFFGTVAGREIDVTPEALAGKVIGVQQGTTNAAYIETHFPKATLQMYPSMDALIADLKIGRIDVAFGDVEPFTGEGGGSAALVKVGEPHAVSEGIGMAFRQDDADLRDQFNAALAQMKKDGTWRELAVKWGIPVYE
ncbi:transporter substrate-binding domain-containing protein [Aquamicrobium lusatiense]|uniref:transporter substrate-binding domain-containing protein n=1 Tax=Aquamicrobium TaxID=69278 RepID=UPI00245905DA|nr:MULTISPECIES: transporter substrate-binding domain-containing protein [Aquamicrobium]MCK9549545.1 transporter substrate-binding domain-containing protein [Aquamicrobium sp.]MDH4989755.1 transporter substrate-binding domain-containing protein [Aquamicrobium lusatiense]